MDSGRLGTHHAPKDARRNFASGTADPSDKLNVPGYIVDYEGKLTPLERKLSKEREEEEKARKLRLKRYLVWSLILLVILIAVVAIVIVCLYFLTCLLGNCPKGCYDCEYRAKKDWRRYRDADGYSGKKRHCGDALEIQYSENSFNIDSSVKISGGKDDIDTSAPLIHSFSKILDGKMQKTLELYWYMEQTVRNNDSLKVVFSDNGDRYAGLGDLGEAVFRAKGTKDHYTLWVDEENPIYLPFYLSRNKEASLCMFADVDGAPIEVTVKGSVTEWLIYKQDKVYFHIYSGASPHRAMERCMKKWREMYPSPDALWAHDFIIGSLSTDEIKTARNTDGILGTHYLLAPNSISIDDGDLKIDNEDAISDYDKVFLSWTAKQNLEDSGFTLTSERGYYKTHEKNIYFLDYSNSKVQTDINSAISTQTSAGLILLHDFHHKPNRPNAAGACPRYIYCAASNPVYFDWDSELCLGEKFGQKHLFQKHNYYDLSRRSALQSASSMIIESVAAPGTTHFHRGDLNLTAEGLRTCFYNILNLQLIGVRAVSCNMCGGLIPQETDKDQSNVCNRWSQLALLMPYMIMTNTETPPLIREAQDSGRYVQNNLNVRKEFRFYLDSAFRQALDNNVPFVYTVGTAYNDDVYTDKEHGVMIGDQMFFVMVLEEPQPGKKFVIALPPGSWFSNGGPLTGEFYNGGKEEEQSSNDMKSLIYFKVPSIFVLDDDLDNENHAKVRIFLPYDGFNSSLKHTHDYYEAGSEVKHSTNIEINAEPGKTPEIRFTYSSPGENVSQDIKISSIEVYLWFEDNANSPSWVDFNARGNNKFNVVFDYIQRKKDVGDEAHSLFETWIQTFEL